MSLKLHIISGAPRGWRVLMGLAFKGLGLEIQLLSFSAKDHHKPEFLSLNPRATIPVLEMETGVLRDSIAILAWLDRAYPEKPLFGATPAQAAEIWQITMECCDYLREGTNQLLSPVFSGDGTVPREGSEERKKLQAAADLVHAECRYLESILADGRLYLGGQGPSAADAVAFPEIRLMQRAVETKHDLLSALGFAYPPDLYPKVADWKARLNDDPAVVATIPSHWGETPLQRKTA